MFSCLSKWCLPKWGYCKLKFMIFLCAWWYINWIVYDCISGVNFLNGGICLRGMIVFYHHDMACAFLCGVLVTYYFSYWYEMNFLWCLSGRLIISLSYNAKSMHMWIFVFETFYLLIYVFEIDLCPWDVCVCAHLCMCVCVCACVHACVRACVRVGVL